jgi:serine/threonine-protein kinase RsbT
MTGQALNPRRFSINGVVDVVRARRSGLDLALKMGFHPAEANKVAVVISELGRNIESYAGRGSIIVTPHTDEEGRYIEIIAEDQGPGIPDVAQVLKGGYTTSKGMGLGISGSKRLMDEFEIHSVVGQGTRIRVTKRV